MVSRLRSILPLAVALVGLGFAVAGGAFYRLWQLPQTARLEFEWQSDEPARVQVYFDSGQGLNESESMALVLSGMPEFQKVRFSLPAMYLAELRLDVTDRDRPLIIRGLTLSVAPYDRDYDLMSLPWRPNNDVVQVEKLGDSLRIVPRTGANDAQLSHSFSPRFRTFTKDSGKFWATLPRALSWGAGASFLAAILVLLWRLRIRWVEPARRHPWAAMTACAALATSISVYPLWLEGRSLVSPHIGAAMLYGGPPFVAGSTSDEMGQAYGADVGALFWSHLPGSRVVAESFTAGEWPYWNRYSSSGVPLFGQGQLMVGDPLQEWVNWMGGAPWAWDVKYALTRFLYAVGLAGSAWLLWGRLSGAAILALATPFVAFFNFRFNHPGTFSTGYAPLLLLAWIGLAKARSRAGIRGALLGIVGASWILLCSGTVKEAYLSFVCFTLMGVVGVWIDSASQEAWRRIKRFASLLVVALVIGLTAPLWFSFLSTQAASFNVYQTPRAHTVPAGLLLGLFDDLFPRLSTVQHFVYTPGGNGLLWIGLGAALVHFRRVSSRAWFLGLATAASLCVALSFSMVPPGVILAMPFLRNVTHIAGIFSSLALVPLWLLAGFGFSSLFSPSVMARRWTVIAPLVAVWIALFACYLVLVPSGAGEFVAFMESRAEYVPDIISWCVGLGLVYCGIAWRKGNALSVVMVGVGFVLLVFRHGLHGPSARDLWPSLVVPGPRVPLDQPSASVRWVQEALREPARVIGTDNEMIPGVTSLYGLEGMNGPDALMVKSYRELLVSAGLTEGVDWRVLWTGERVASHRKILDLLGVRFVFSRLEEIPRDPGISRRQRLDLNVFERSSAWPRAFFTSSLKTYRGADDFIAQLGAHVGGPTAWMEEKDLASMRTTLHRSDPEISVAARDYRLTPNRTRFRIDAPGPGLAVLQEAYHPGYFHARLNGSTVPLIRVNHAFKAVEIPEKGTYEVEVAVEPNGMAVAWRVSLASLVGVGVLILRIRGRNDARVVPQPRV